MLWAIIRHRRDPSPVGFLLSGPNQLEANPSDPIPAKQQGMTDRVDTLGTGSSGSGLPSSEGLPTETGRRHHLLSRVGRSVRRS